MDVFAASQQNERETPVQHVLRLHGNTEAQSHLESEMLVVVLGLNHAVFIFNSLCTSCHQHL